MFENPMRGRQAKNFTTNVPKLLDLKSSSEQIFSKNWCWVPLTFRSSLRKGEPSWSVTLTWSRPLSLTSLRILISYFLCLCVSVFMYVCFSRCNFNETTKGRRRWVLILNRNISVFVVSEYSPTYLLTSHIKVNPDSGFWNSDSGFRNSDSWFWNSDFGF